MGNMAAPRPDVRFTLEDYRALPEGSRVQLVGGELLVSPSPTRRHQLILIRLASALHAFVEARGLGQVLAAPMDVVLSDHDVPQPDIVFVSTARSAALVPEGVRGAPDLCVEILSPRSAAFDRGPKRKLYALHGVIEYWIVDGDANRIELYRLQEDPAAPRRTFEAAEKLETPILPGFEIDLAALFS